MCENLFNRSAIIFKKSKEKRSNQNIKFTDKNSSDQNR